MSSSLLTSLRVEFPAAHRSNFWHLCLDILWFGILNGTSIAFVAVFATRLGASTFQIGILNAAPAIVTLFMALPAGQWLASRSLNHTVFWSSLVFRFFYLTWALLPFFFDAPGQINALLVLTFAMSIPGTVLSIGFNSLFAAAVPAEWRGYIVGIRNAMLSLSSVVVSLMSGWLLDSLPMPLNYQLVFGIGFLGALMSSVHLWFVRPIGDPEPPQIRQLLNDWARPGIVQTWPGIRSFVGLRSLTLPRATFSSWLQVHLLRSRFGVALALLVTFHFAQYLVIPVFPLYTVNEVGLSDWVLSWGNMLFYATLFVGSLQLVWITGRFGNHTTLAVGVLLMSLYPIFIALADNATFYYVASLVGGIAWALAGGALGNYLLDNVPEDNRPPHLAWYNLGLQTAVLAGSLLGPFLATQIGLVETLYVGSALRFSAAVLIWFWGRERHKR